MGEATGAGASNEITLRSANIREKKYRSGRFWYAIWASTRIPVGALMMAAPDNRTEVRRSSVKQQGNAMSNQQLYLALVAIWGGEYRRPVSQHRPFFFTSSR